MNRHERRKTDTLQRLAEKREAKQRGDRTDNPTAPLSATPGDSYVDFGGADATTPEPVAAIERPCVYAKAVFATQQKRRKARSKASHQKRAMVRKVKRAAGERRFAKYAAMKVAREEAVVE